MTMTENDENSLFVNIVKGSSLLVAALALGSCFMMAYRLTLGIVAGGIIAIVNFIWLRSVLERIFTLPPQKAASFTFSRHILKLAVNAIVLYLLIISGEFAISGILIGLSTIVITISAITIYFAVRKGG
jgi:hypothetical protein